MAIQNLSGLGATEGPAAGVIWTPFFSLWGFLPCAVLLPLLLLPRNRNRSAWLVVGLLAAESLVLSALGGVLAGMIGSAGDELMGFFTTLAVGFAAAWLTAPYLSRRPRWLSALALGLCVLAAELMGGISMAAQMDRFANLGAILVATIFLVGTTTLAWFLASLCCRRKLGFLRFSIWLVFWNLAAWILSMTPIILVQILSRNSGIGQVIIIQCIATLAIAVCACLVMLGFVGASARLPSMRARWEALAGYQPPPAPTAASSEII